MNSELAAYHTVHDWPGGAESLAPMMGMSAAILRGKVNPNDAKHHLTLREASALMVITGDDRILHALAAEQGAVVRYADADEPADLRDATLRAVAAKGVLAAKVAEATADGIITNREADEIERHSAASMAATAEVARQARAAAKRKAAGRAAA